MSAHTALGGETTGYHGASRQRKIMPPLLARLVTG